MKTFLGAVICEYNRKKDKKSELVTPLLALYYYYTHIEFRATTLVHYYASLPNGIKRRRIYRKLYIKYGINIGPDCRLGANLEIMHIHGIVLGKKSIIGNDCKIYQNVTLGKKNDGYPTIGNNVTLYPGATVIGKIKIGDNAVIAPGAVVIHDVPEDAVVGGIPAKTLK